MRELGKEKERKDSERREKERGLTHRVNLVSWDHDTVTLRVYQT